jgi:hypothetical protein
LTSTALGVSRFVGRNSVNVVAMGRSIASAFFGHRSILRQRGGGVNVKDFA